MESTIINGVDTIDKPEGEHPLEYKISFGFVRRVELMREQWNDKYMALIIYCMFCKEPLMWHQASVDGVLFQCPSCERTWIKDDEWDSDRDKYRQKLLKQQHGRRHGK